MRKFPVQAFLNSRYPLAVAAGVLLSTAFPNSSIAGSAWLAPGLILAAALGKTGGEAFRIGYVAGLAHYLMALRWLLNIPVTGFPILGWIALSAFLALLTGTWTWSCLHVSRFTFHASRTTPWLEAARTFSRRSLNERLAWPFVCAALWVALEMLIARLFGGFPWNLLGASQFKIIPLIQIASFTGVYGVSFLVAWMSVSLLGAVLTIMDRPTMRWAWLGDVLPSAMLVMVAFVFGFRHLSGPPEYRLVKIALIQPSIPQTVIWDPEGDDLRFKELLRLSHDALTNDVDVLLWPEAAVPKRLRYDQEIFEAVTNLASGHRVWMILGADDAELPPGATDSRQAEFYNASFLVSPEGHLIARYKKRSLVIFGEYIPLERWLPFMKWFTPVEVGFTAGDRAVPFRMTDLGLTTSVLICFEDNFPHLVRGYVDADTDFLVNLTNNGWFGEGAAQRQHAANAVFRSVENGVPLVRCTNNGLTCWVDEFGRLRDVFVDRSGGIYGAGFLIANVSVPQRNGALTFYTRHGDWFGWGCVGLAVLSLGAGKWKGAQSPSAAR